MKGTARGVMLLLAAGACNLWAQADIGQLVLSGSNFGEQTVGLYNFTGATDGCEVIGSQYNVCNGVDITSWQLQIDFIPNVAGLPTSPLIFDSNGSSDVIGPTDASFDLYTGDAAAPWSLSFDLANSGCSPTCDAYISQIIFSGTLDTNTLQLGTDPTLTTDTPLFLASDTFSTTWNVPLSDYTDPNTGANVTDSIYDSNDIIITNQAAPPGSSTPEPGSVYLLVAGVVGIGLWKRKLLA